MEEASNELVFVDGPLLDRNDVNDESVDANDDDDDDNDDGRRGREIVSRRWYVKENSSPMLLMSSSLSSTTICYSGLNASLFHLLQLWDRGGGDGDGGGVGGGAFRVLDR